MNAINIIKLYKNEPNYYDELIAGDKVMIISHTKWGWMEDYLNIGGIYEVVKVEDIHTNVVCRSCYSGGIHILLKDNKGDACSTCNIVLGNVSGQRLKVR